MLDRIQTFPCPNCRQFISDRADACRFCGVAVDHGIAQIVAHTQRRVNQACSDASHLRSAAFVMWTFLLVSLIPYVPLVTWSFLVTLVLVAVLLVRWQLRFGYIENTSDPDYAKAKRNRSVALALWLAALLAAFVLVPLFVPEAPDMICPSCE